MLDDWFDNDFEINDDNLKNEKSLVEEKLLEIVKTLENYTKNLRDSIEYSESQDIESGLEKISSLVSLMINLYSIRYNDDEEILDYIREINIQIKELNTFQEVDDYAQDFDEINGYDLAEKIEDTNKKEESDEESNDSDDDFDF